jgi:hypothetical protein
LNKHFLMGHELDEFSQKFDSNFVKIRPIRVLFSINLNVNRRSAVHINK